MTQEEELKILKELNDKMNHSVTHMANFVVGHPWMFSELAAEESEKMLEKLKKIKVTSL